MPVSDGANSIFADKAQALISGVMYALVDLRDKGLLKLSTSVIRDALALEKCVELALRPELDAESSASIKAALGTSGWIAGRELKDQPPSFAEQFGYAQSYFGKALSSLTDTYSHIYGVEDGEVLLRQTGRLSMRHREAAECGHDGNGDPSKSRMHVPTHGVNGHSKARARGRMRKFRTRGRSRHIGTITRW